MVLNGADDKFFPTERMTNLTGDSSKRKDHMLTVDQFNKDESGKVVLDEDGNPILARRGMVDGFMSVRGGHNSILHFPEHIGSAMALLGTVERQIEAKEVEKKNGV